MLFSQSNGIAEQTESRFQSACKRVKAIELDCMICLLDKSGLTEPLFFFDCFVNLNIHTEHIAVVNMNSANNVQYILFV